MQSVALLLAMAAEDLPMIRVFGTVAHLDVVPDHPAVEPDRGLPLTLRRNSVTRRGGLLKLNVPSLKGMSVVYTRNA
jgi:hypothetical protein